jgi:hypothetical protein
MTAQHLGEEWEGHKKTMRLSFDRLAGSWPVKSLAPSRLQRASHHGKQWYKLRQARPSTLSLSKYYSPMQCEGAQAQGLRTEPDSEPAARGRGAYTRAKRWAHRRSPISGMVPNKPKPAKLMSHSASGQSSEQSHWSNPLGGHASVGSALAGSHLNVTLS